MKRAFLTGAFGNLGRYIIDLLLERGYSVTCFDLPSKPNRKVARAYEGKLAIIWGDIRDSSLYADVLAHQDVIIHLAAVLPPVTDDLPELAQAINVEASRQMLELASAAEKPPLFLFASSFTVFGDNFDVPPPRRSTDPVRGSDNYTRFKIESEQAVQAYKGPWAILRIGVSLDESLQLADKRLIKQMLIVRADNRMEYVHPGDVALAFVNAIEREQAWNNIWLIGGGKQCRIYQRDMVRAGLGSAGLQFSDSELGSDSYYTDWIDSEAAQAVLDFQTITFDMFEKKLRQKLKLIRLLVRPFAQPAKYIFLRLIA